MFTEPPPAEFSLVRALELLVEDKHNLLATHQMIYASEVLLTSENKANGKLRPLWADAMTVYQGTKGVGTRVLFSALSIPLWVIGAQEVCTVKSRVMSLVTLRALWIAGKL